MSGRVDRRCGDSYSHLKAEQKAKNEVSGTIRELIKNDALFRSGQISEVEWLKNRDKYGIGVPEPGGGDTHDEDAIRRYPDSTFFPRQ